MRLIVKTRVIGIYIYINNYLAGFHLHLKGQDSRYKGLRLILVIVSANITFP